MQNSNWRISGTAVQGLMHLEKNTPCQDKIYSLEANGVTTIALADGAGSVKFAHFGAEAAVRGICQKLCADFEHILNNNDPYAVRTDILNSVLLELEKTATEKNCAVDEMACTLLAAACNGENVLTVHVGDGLIAYCKDGETLVASLPDNGEFKDETVFITSPDALHRMRLSRGRAKGVSEFVLMSDGTAESFYKERTKTFATLLEEIRQRCVMYSPDESNADLEELFSDTVRRKTSDDCSIIIMCRPDEHFRGYRDLDDYDKYNFLGVKDPETKEHLEKVLSIFDGKEYVSRYQVIKRACALGLKRQQVCELIRDMQKSGLIERVHIFPRRYRLTFSY